MIEKEIYMVKKEYRDNKNIINYIMSIVMDIFFLITFRLVIYFLGYLGYVNNNPSIIIIMSIIIEVLLLIYSLIYHYNKNKTIIIKEGNRMLFVKEYSDEMEISNGSLEVNNMILRNVNDIYSVIIGLIINRKENSKLYNKSKRLYVDFNKKYTTDDILDDLSINFKCYDNCELLSQNRKYSLYQGDKLNNDGSTKKVRFKIYYYFECTLCNEVKNV